MAFNVRKRNPRLTTNATAQRHKQKPKKTKNAITFEQMKGIVGREMEERRKALEPRFGQPWKIYFFNNFRLLLPGEKVINPQFRDPSSKMKKTAQQVVSEVNQVIQNLHINPQSISELQPKNVAKKLGIKSPMDMTPEHRKAMAEATTKLHEIATPIYIEMRRRGYSHKDLAQ